MTPNNSQWFITGVVEVEDNLPRTFGFYKEYGDAYRAVRINQGGMRECLYEYLVIEKIKEGIHSSVDEEVWFKWDDKRNEWKECEKPKQFLDTINWALG
jgi:hypothetical protein